MLLQRLKRCSIVEVQEDAEEEPNEKNKEEEEILKKKTRVKEKLKKKKGMQNTKFGAKERKILQSIGQVAPASKSKGCKTSFQVF